MQFSGAGYRVYTRRDGMPDTEVFSIHETREGDLLLGTRDGLVRMSGSGFTETAMPPAMTRGTCSPRARAAARFAANGWMPEILSIETTLK